MKYSKSVTLSLENVRFLEKESNVSGLIDQLLTRHYTEALPDALLKQKRITSLTAEASVLQSEVTKHENEEEERKAVQKKEEEDYERHLATRKKNREAWLKLPKEERWKIITKKERIKLEKIQNG